MGHFHNVNAAGGSSANANGNGGCFVPGTAYSKEFVNAWQRIWNIFYQQAPYVSFVWNPNVLDTANGDLVPNVVDPYTFYPGPNYVEWIGLDGYNKQTETQMSPAVWTPIGFDAVFHTSLNEFANSTYGKPIMIGETGSCSEYPAPYTQSSYLSDLYTFLNENQNSSSPYSYVKALNYFDAPGSYDDQNTGQPCLDQLLGGGRTEFSTIANSTLFSPTINP